MAVDKAMQQAQAAGRVERHITLQLVKCSQRDAVLALDELLQAEGTRIRSPDGGPRVAGGGGRFTSRANRSASGG